MSSTKTWADQDRVTWLVQTAVKKSDPSLSRSVQIIARPLLDTTGG